MSERVPERLLERARLGELNEAELEELMTRLQAEEGGLARLDALIEQDARFLERFPITPMAAQIRDRAERSTRAKARKPTEKKMPILISPLIKAVLAAAVLALSGIVGFEVNEWSSPDSSTAVPRVDVAPAPPKTDPAAVARPPKPHALPADSMLKGLQGRLGESSEIVMATGDTIAVPALGITRVTIDLTAVMAARSSDDHKSLLLTAGEPGVTAIRFYKGDQIGAVLYARVAELMKDSEPLETTQLEKCQAEAEKVGTVRGKAAMDFLVAPSGTVVTARLRESTVPGELTDCLRGVTGWRFAEFKGTSYSPYQLARLEVVFDGGAARIKQ